MKKFLLLSLLCIFTINRVKAQQWMPFEPITVSGYMEDYETDSLTHFYVLTKTVDVGSINWDYYYKILPKSALNIELYQVNKLQDSLSKKLDKSNIYGWAKEPIKPSYSYSELSGTPSLFSGKYSDLTGKPSLFSGNYNDLVGRPTLSSSALSGSYNDLINKPTIVNYSSGNGISLTGGVVTNTLPDQTVILSSGNRIAITGTYPNFTISYIEPTANTVTRSLNTNYTISATKQASVFYSITSSATNPLLAGTSSGNAYLEYSINSGTTWVGVSQTGNSNGVGVAVAVALTNGQTSVLSGIIPANALVRIRTVTAGSATVVYTSGQETY